MPFIESGWMNSNARLAYKEPDSVCRNWSVWSVSSNAHWHMERALQVYKSSFGSYICRSFLGWICVSLRKQATQFWQRKAASAVIGLSCCGHQPSFFAALQNITSSNWITLYFAMFVYLFRLLLAKLMKNWNRTILKNDNTNYTLVAAQTRSTFASKCSTDQLIKDTHIWTEQGHRYNLKLSGRRKTEPSASRRRLFSRDNFVMKAFPICKFSCWGGVEICLLHGAGACPNSSEGHTTKLQISEYRFTDKLTWSTDLQKQKIRYTMFILLTFKRYWSVYKVEYVVVVVVVVVVCLFFDGGLGRFSRTVKL